MIQEKPSPMPTTAVALRYDGTGAPRVTAQGRGLVAEQILAQAEEHGIPLYRDTGLAQLLAQVELGEEIPATLYEAVAQVLAFIYRLSGETPAHLRID
ncbi:MAG: EscU/YscU/HrcU family type III secretion system export apparatus switch protein [Gammaproteobacteria bacterium]|nr:EscU/YscU/HrcU family type III secretion system export apparatus switch protein [Gammaproteobacteria bacterium]